MMYMLGSVEEVVGVVAVGGGLAVAIVAIIFGAAKKMVQTTARERTKREVAAYVAEGTMTPEQAQQILRADMPPRDEECCGKKG